MHSTSVFSPLRALGVALFLALAQVSPSAAAAQSPSATGSCPAAEPATVNVNTADDGELQQLPRIGPARAQAILRMRTHLGGFKRASQLLRVKGIGRATLRQLLPLIRLTDPPVPVDASEPASDAVGFEGR